MPIIRVQTTLHADTGLPEDVAVNNWYFETAALPEYTDDIPPLMAVRDFYDSMSNHLSPFLSGTATHKVYELNDPTPRVPRRTIDDNITVGSSGLPNEVAVCLSYRGTYESGEINARRRGRVFIGPLATTASDGGNAPRPSSAIRTALLNGCLAIQAALASTPWDWVVYSPTLAGVSPGAASAGTPVVQAWVDDAFDTQRRRGLAPTTRQTATITQ